MWGSVRVVFLALHKFTIVLKLTVSCFFFFFPRMITLWMTCSDGQCGHAGAGRMFYISGKNKILAGISWSLISPHYCHHLSVFFFSQFLKTCHFHLVTFTFPIYFMCSIPSQPFSFNLTLPLSLFRYTAFKPFSLHWLSSSRVYILFEFAHVPFLLCITHCKVLLPSSLPV